MMNFENWLQEGSKYTKGSWKQQVKAIINDFKDKDIKHLKKALDTFTEIELTNLTRNTIGFKKYNKDQSLNDFLDTIVKTATETINNLPEPKSQIPKVSNKDWSDFEKLIKSHDVFYDRSDDRKVYQKGKSQHDKIMSKYRILTQVDKIRADKLMKIIREK